MRLKANLRHEQSTKKHDEVMNMRDKFKKKNSPEVESTKGFRSYDDISFEMLETSATRDKKNLKEGANFFGSKKVEFETIEIAREYVALFEKLAGQLVGVSKQVLEQNFMKGLKPDLRMTVRVMHSEGLNHAMILAVTIEEKNV
ncbi:hypothetical protein Tco_0844952 [Tanacetum coccineum]